MNAVLAPAVACPLGTLPVFRACAVIDRAMVRLVPGEPRRAFVRHDRGFAWQKF